MDTIEVWPHCPECKEPRVTFCPFCEHTGSDFLPVDLQESVEDELEEFETEQDPNTGRFDLPIVNDTNPAPKAICPDCDEPFAPRYARICGLCSHEFEDGYEPKVSTQIEEENEVNVRVILTLMILGVIFGVLMLGLSYLK